MPSAFNYCRVSTGAQTSMALEAQKLVGEELYNKFLKKDYPTLETFTDIDVSARENDFHDRPQAKLLHAKLQKGDCIILPKFDRGFRNLRDALNTFHYWEKLGVRVVSPDFPISGGHFFDSQNQLCKMGMVFIAWFAEIESDRTSQRMKDFFASQKAKGRITNGQLPFGFRKESRGEPTGARNKQPQYWQVADKERAILDFMLQCKARGFTEKAILNHLVKNNILNPRNGEHFNRKMVENCIAHHRKIVAAEKAYREKHGTGLKPWQFISPDMVLCERFDKQAEKEAYYANLRTYTKKPPTGEEEGNGNES